MLSLSPSLLLSLFLSHSLLSVVVEGKRSSGLTAVWLARNRFAILDKSHQVGCVVYVRMLGCVRACVCLCMRVCMHSWAVCFIALPPTADYQEPSQ